MTSNDTPDWTDPTRVMVMTAALAGFLNWAVGEDDAWAGFTAATGLQKPSAPRNALDCMIDDATGHTDAVMRRFVAWVIPAMWGTIDEVPPDMRGLLTVERATA